MTTEIDKESFAHSHAGQNSKPDVYEDFITSELKGPPQLINPSYREHTEMQTTLRNPKNDLR
jgi:hypothetical protein